MSDNVKSIAAGIIGIILGVVLTYLGINELNKKILSAAEEIGKTTSDLDKEKKRLAALGQDTEDLLKELSNQKAQLQYASDEIDRLFKNVQNLDGQSAEENIAMLQSLTKSLKDSDSVERLIKLEGKIDSLENYVENRVAPSEKWPHAINCGVDWDALYILHGAPRKDGQTAWYVQVFPNEYRYVRFKSDASFLDRGGHQLSSQGCENKTISQLKAEGRAFQFVKSLSINPAGGI